jgi:SAM-dependent methyltransferase
MTIKRLLENVAFRTKAVVARGNTLRQLQPIARGMGFGRKWARSNAPPARRDMTNPLRTFFDVRRDGPGIWKWDHYFEIYDRHLSRFRGKEVHILEIGIYSGGSLDMWRDYFGPGCHIYGVDIEPACRAYESNGVKVFIGDQADRSFWSRFRAEVPALDIVIDDGGHTPEQQITTIEELLQHLRPGGVFICEDVHGRINPTNSFAYGLSCELHSTDNATENLDDPERRIVVSASPLQASIDGMHVYPFVTVLERSTRQTSEFICAKHGTQWQPFLK